MSFDYPKPDLTAHEQTDLGPNARRLYEVTQQFSNATYVDLGVREGWSSSILCSNSVPLNNTIYGVDVDFTSLKFNLVQGQNYKTILGDSVTVGKNWGLPQTEKGPVEIVFVDTIHVEQQVLCELYYWVPQIVEGGYVIFHDTHWPNWLVENVGGVQWPQPVGGVLKYFGLSEMADYEDGFIQVKTYPDSYGMTFVKIKKQKDFRSNVHNWAQVFDDRNRLISMLVQGPSKVMEIDHVLTPSTTPIVL